MRFVCLSCLITGVIVCTLANAQTDIRRGPVVDLPTPYGYRIIAKEGPGKGGVASQAEIDAVSDARIKDYLNLIDEVEREGGAYAVGLEETLSGLGQAYQSRGEHEKAIDAHRRAMHLTRVNQGLATPAQIPLIKSILSSQLAMKQWNQANNTQEYLFFIHKQTAGSSGEVPADPTKDYLRWRRQAYLLNIGNNRHKHLSVLNTLHRREITRLSMNNKDNPALVPYLYGLLQYEYLFSKYNNEQSSDMGLSVSRGSVADVFDPRYQAQLRSMQDTPLFRGVRTLNRLINVLEADENAPAEDILRAKLALGDWYLWYRQIGQANRHYALAYEFIVLHEELGEPDSYFSKPLELPVDATFHTEFGFGEEENLGRAVVRFNVSRMGVPKEVEVVAIEPEDHRIARFKLLKWVKNLAFRPRMENKKAVATENITREYIFQY